MELPPSTCNDEEGSSKKKHHGKSNVYYSSSVKGCFLGVSESFINIISVSSTYVLRVTVISSLLVAAVLCGVLVYVQLSMLETQLFESEYYSVSNDGLHTALANVNRKSYGAITMAKVLGNTFVDAAQ